MSRPLDEEEHDLILRLVIVPFVGVLGIEPSALDMNPMS
jgi:hypothetical protein